MIPENQQRQEASSCRRADRADLSVMKGRVVTILLFVTTIMVRFRPKAKPAAHAAAHAPPSTATATALTAFGLIPLVPATGRTWPRRALYRNRQVRRDGIEIERLTNEGAQRYDQFLGRHELAGGKLVRRTRCQTDLFVRAEQDDVG